MMVVVTVARTGSLGEPLGALGGAVSFLGFLASLLDFCWPFAMVCSSVLSWCVAV